MRPNQAKSQLGEARLSLNFQQFITALVLVLCIILALMLWRSHKAEKLVMQTPWGDRSRWISESEGPSPQLLIDNAFWMAHLNLDVSPASLKTNSELLQTWIPPAEWKKMKKKVDDKATEVRRTSAVESFAPLFAVPDPANLRIALTGEYRQWIGEIAIPPRMRTFAFVFKQEGTRLYFVDWFESSKQAPYERLEKGDSMASATKK